MFGIDKFLVSPRNISRKNTTNKSTQQIKSNVCLAGCYDIMLLCELEN